MSDNSELTLGRFLFYGFGCAGCLWLIGAMFGCGEAQQATSTPPEAIAQADRPLLPETTVATCRKTIDAATSAGLIKSQPSPERINVEDRLWAALPVDERRALLGFVGCTAFKRRIEHWAEPDDILSGFVVAYGHRSGKRLAMASANGYDFE
jgi:hypothetical protein